MKTVHCTLQLLTTTRRNITVLPAAAYMYYILSQLAYLKVRGHRRARGGGRTRPHQSPNFHLKERLLNLRRRECFVCLPSYYFMPLPKAKFPNFSARQYLRICKFLCLSLRGQNGGVFERKMWQYKSRDTQTQKKLKCPTSIFLNLHCPSQQQIYRIELSKITS